MVLRWGKPWVAPSGLLTAQQSAPHSVLPMERQTGRPSVWPKVQLLALQSGQQMERQTGWPWAEPKVQQSGQQSGSH
jgi:hypothetical protein